MKTVQEQYFDCCDRLYLNNVARYKATKRSKIIEEQIEKDEKLKHEFERKLGL